MIPPQELNKRTFSKGLRGYEPTEVDEYISFLIEKYTELFSQCDEYQNKLRLVANRISEIDAKEEAIHKLVISTQKYCDSLKEEAEQKAAEILREAQENSQNIVAEAEFKEERILINAKEIAENTLLAVSEKAEEQIEDSREKSEALLMSARTRCAKILNDFRKEIVVQREGLTNLKAMTDDFHNTIFGMYKEHLNSLTEKMPETDLDLDYLTESRLLSSIMQDIKKDAVNIAERNGNKEYDFEEELAALKIDADDIEANISKDVESRPRASANAEAAHDSGDSTDSAESGKTTIFTKVPEVPSNGVNRANSEEDVKVFAGKVAVAASMAGDTMIFDKNTVNNTSLQEHEEQYEQGTQDEHYEEEPIATYDSDDFSQDDYNSRKSGSNEAEDDAGYSSLSSGGVYDGSEDNDDNDDDDDGDSGDSRRVGFLGSLFGKKKNSKKKNSSKNRDDDDIDYELDDDDDDYDIDIDDL